jgi:hypothetical protein
MNYKTVLLASLVLAAGCSRVSTETTLNPDGSFTRAVTYTVTKGSFGGSKVSDPNAVFHIPANGNGVTVEKKETNDDITVTVTRKVPAGAAPLQDITLKDQSGKDELASQVTVTKGSDGNLDYEETVHWTGGHTLGGFPIDASFRAQIKKSLPERFVKTDIIDAVTRDLTAYTVQALFGPPDPLILGMLNPDVMKFRIAARVRSAMTPILSKDLQGIKPDEASKVSDSLLSALDVGGMAKNKVSQSADPTGDDSKKTNESDATLTYAVHYNGKLVSTNGIADEEDHLVYWSMLDVAAEIGDVKLQLVVAPG